MSRLMPAELYRMAEQQHPADREALRDRYRQLMIEHGHIAPREDDGELAASASAAVIVGTLAGVAAARAQRRRR